MNDRGVWRCGRIELEVFDRVHVMGILNVTPDSFSDGGLYLDLDDAIKRSVAMASDGADIIDIGGESTRPGSGAVSEDDELRRVVPVIEAVLKETGLPISIDTTKAAVAEAAIEAGAVIVNDVSAMRSDRRIIDVVKETGAGVVLMHMLGEPKTMQKDPRYTDVVEEVAQFLDLRAGSAQDSGIAPESIAIDPGFGFGKTREHNLALLKYLEAFSKKGHPLLVGVSRKAFIGATLDLDVDSRLEGTAAAVAWAVANGANIVRVHDVLQMSRVVRMIEAIKGA